jgi:type I restriction enzyme, S subunit
VRVTVGVVVNPSSYFEDEGVPFIHGRDVQAGWIDTTELKRLSPTSNALLAKSQLHTGDVVVMRVGEPGRSAAVPAELDGSNCASILILRHGSLVSPHYLAYFLNSAVGRAQVALAQYGAAQEVINVSDIVDFVLPVPPRKVQEAIVADLDDLCTANRNAIRAATDQMELLAERRQALITAAVTGQIEIPGVAA